MYLKVILCFIYVHILETAYMKILMFVDLSYVSIKHVTNFTVLVDCTSAMLKHGAGTACVHIGEGGK